MTKQNEPIRQHYLPKMYLKNFCNQNNKIWVYNDKTDEVKELSTKDTTVIKHFYTLKKDDGSKDYYIENNLSKIEDLCAPIINKLVAGNVINSEEKGYLSVFIAVLQNRTPKAVDLINQIMNPMLKIQQEHIKHSKAMKDLIEQGKKEYGLDENLINEILDNIEPSLTKSGEWGFLMDVAIHMAKLYSQMEWHFCYTDKSSFITTDNPILVYPATYDTGPYGNIGVALPTVEKHLTIAPNLMLRIGDLGNPTIEYHTLNDKKVIREINKSQIVFREQFAIAKDQGHLEYLIKQTKNKKFKTHIKIN